MQALKDRDSDLLSILDSRAAAYSKLAQHDQALRDTKQMIKCGKNDERVRRLAPYFFIHTDWEGVFTLCQNPPAEWQAGQGTRSLRIRVKIPTYKPSTAPCELCLYFSRPSLYD